MTVLRLLSPALLLALGAASSALAQAAPAAPAPTVQEQPADPNAPHAASDAETAPSPDAAEAAAASQAASPEIEAQTRQLAAELRCPVCQGLSIEDSPTELSQQMKNVIRQQLAQGKTPEQVREYFVGRYGEWILLQPKAKGFNLLVYLLPLLGLLAGGAVVAASVRRWTRPASAADDTAPAPAPDDEPALSA